MISFMIVYKTFIFDMFSITAWILFRFVGLHLSVPKYLLKQTICIWFEFDFTSIEIWNLFNILKHFLKLVVLLLPENTKIDVNAAQNLLIS